MKYKKKLIQRIKDKYGVSDLFFYKGYKSEVHSPGFPISICSFKRNPKKVYKNQQCISIYSRFTHTELDNLLFLLSCEAKQRSIGFSRSVRKVLFEQWDTEFEDLYSLKQAYLISYLAGI